jgi:hypothetical protein
MNDFFARIHWIQLDLLRLPGLSCAYPDVEYFFTLRFTLLLPFGVGALMAAAWWCAVRR